MKKVLVISGSPRPKGNTFKITNLVEENVKKYGEVEFDYFFLKKANLDFCRGCLICMKKGEEFCPCKDDSLILRDKMASADGIVFISPVYVHSVSALMKNFYDRFAYMCHQPRLIDKPSLLIVTTELSGGAETLKYMEFPAFTWGCKIIDTLDVVYDSFKEESSYRSKTLKRISAVSEKFYKAIESADPKPTFKDLVFFNLMKTKVTMHRNLLPEDYNFWKENGWLNSTYYYQNSIPVLKRRLAGLAAKKAVNKITKTYGIEIN